ncbi:hypothetical protein DRP53_10780, partial [candidate division WOR-3 bacterium]
MGKKFILLILGGVMVLSAHDLSVHMSLGEKTFDVWKEFDYDFYEYITKHSWPGEDSVQRTLVRKFYYIGLTFPDMFWSDAQSIIRELIDSLHGVSGLKDPFKIKDETNVQVQIPIEFSPGDNSHNLSKLWRMAQHAKSHGWTPYEKSLIYGSLMHVIHDLYAHMVMQPTLFGYGRVFDSDSALSQILLAFGERYHEMFSPTFINNWPHFVKTLYASKLIKHTPAIIQDACCFYREIDEAGRVTTWQNIDFVPVEKFVEAAHAVGWEIKNLTRERLEAYLHGWAIFTFLLYGYRSDGSDIGGLLAHPNWTFEQYLHFVLDIGFEREPHWIFAALPEWLQKIIREAAHQYLMVFFPEGLKEYPWPEYFESVANFDEFWRAVPEELKPKLQAEYERWRQNLRYWEESDDGNPRTPRMRNSYADETKVAQELTKFYRESLRSGPNYYAEYMEGLRLDAWTIGRKAGLLAGLYPIPSDQYPRPPGVVSIGFSEVGKNGVWVYTNIETEEEKIIYLCWDIFFKGKILVQFCGRKGDGSVVVLGQKGYIFPTHWERRNEYLGCDVHDAAVNEDVVEIFWRIQAIDYPYPTILQSDYREAYWQSPLVYENKLYQVLFKEGDPTRKPSEHPFYNNGSKYYWPYTIRIYCLLRPVNAEIKRITTNQVRLTWTDRSGKETGYRIARKVEGEDWDTTYATVPANTEEFIDTVTVAHRYTYKVKA